MKRLVCTFVLVLSLAGVASAQDSSWGVSAAVVPSWSVPAENEIFKAMFDADEIDITGNEFRIGFVRGRTLGGDWGVSFVHRRLDDGSTLSTDFGGGSEIPFPIGETITTRGVSIDGVEVHKFTPFGTIKGRVQIGLLYGGGVGTTKGTLDVHTVDADFAFVGNRPVIRPVESTEMRDAKELIFPGNGIVPLGRLELAIAGIIMPGLKVRASGGLSFPGTHSFSISGVYLFGAN